VSSGPAGFFFVQITENVSPEGSLMEPWTSISTIDISSFFLGYLIWVCKVISDLR
jgi:hypothetical protein